MIEYLGENRQRELIGLWNDEPRPPASIGAIPRGMASLAEDGLQLLWVEAGVPQEMAGRMTHLYSTMLDALFEDFEGAAPLGEWSRAVDAHLADQPAAYSNARIICNQILAIHILDGDTVNIIDTSNRILGILSDWRAAEPDMGRHYEDDLLKWVRTHADDFEAWSRHFRGRVDEYQ